MCPVKFCGGHIQVLHVSNKHGWWTHAGVHAFITSLLRTHAGSVCVQKPRLSAHVGLYVSIAYTYWTHAAVHMST